jgi:hypothetical protein
MLLPRINDPLIQLMGDSINGSKPRLSKSQFCGVRHAHVPHLGMLSPHPVIFMNAPLPHCALFIVHC